MALSGFLKSGKVCFSDFGTRTFVMFRLIPGIFGHAKIMLRYFRTSNIISNVIGCNFMYRLFNIHQPTASVITFACLLESSLCIASSALNYQLCVHRARMGAQSCLLGEDWSILSLGRGLVNLASRERIGQSFPGCKDAR